MPVSVVKTPEQEKMWEEAKARAAEEGQKENWAYVMSIYKKMSGFKKKASLVGDFFGKGAGKAKAEINTLKGNMAFASNKLKEQKNILGHSPSDSDVRKKFKVELEQLRALKEKEKEEGHKAFIARAKVGGGVAATGGIGAAIAASKNTGNNDEFKPQYLQASEETELAEKLASFIVKKAGLGSKLTEIGAKLSKVPKSIGGAAKTIAIGTGLGVGAYGLTKAIDERKPEDLGPLAFDETAYIEKVAAFKDILKAIGTGIKDAATFNGFKNAVRDYKAYKAGNLATGKQNINDMLGLRSRIQALQTRNTGLAKEITDLNHDNVIPPEQIDNAIDRILNSADDATKFDANFANKRRADNLRGVLTQNDKVLNAAKNKLEQARLHLAGRQEDELAKSLLLYGAGGAGAYYGVKKLKKKKLDL